MQTRLIEQRKALRLRGVRIPAPLTFTHVTVSDCLGDAVVASVEPFHNDLGS